MSFDKLLNFRKILVSSNYSVMVSVGNSENFFIFCSRILKKFLTFAWLNNGISLTMNDQSWFTDLTDLYLIQKKWKAISRADRLPKDLPITKMLFLKPSSPIVSLNFLKIRRLSEIKLVMVGFPLLNPYPGNQPQKS